jgi:hypothetical protein
MTETVISARTDSCRYARQAITVFGFIAWIAIFILAFSSLVQGQPPPVGPASYRSDKSPQIGVGVLTNGVKAMVQKAVNDTNDYLQKQGKSIRVSALPLQSWAPSRFATQYTNRPNQYYVKLPTIIGINVSIPVVSDRQIYIPLDMNVSCDGWQTGSGVIRIDAQTGPASVEGGNILEEILSVKDYITKQVESYVPSVTSTQTLPNSQCVTIGVPPSSQYPDPSFSFIAWDPPQRILATGASALPPLEVTFMRLKRLTARGNNGILYYPTENIVLETYANYTYSQSAVLTMQEGDELNLNIAPAVVRSPLLDSLVLIANINQQTTTGLQDSAFAASFRSANFSPGVHTLQIPKRFIIPPSRQNPKPQQINVPAYELTYNVRYSSPGAVAR